jgi:hypothetical protein
MNRAAPVRRASLCRVAFCAVFLLPCVVISDDDEGPVFYDWGPIASRIEGIDGMVRRQIIGPFYEHGDAPDGDQFAAYRPLYVRYRDAEKDRVQREYLWPIAISKTLGDHYYWRFLLAYYYDWDLSEPESRTRLMVFPFYYQGRDSKGEKFLAVWPFGGTMREMFWNDKITFVMWPIRIKTEINEAQTSHWVWPIYAKGSGEDMERFRVLPFYGSYTRDRVTRKSIMWPFHTSVGYQSPTAEGDGYIMWPFWGHFSYPSEKTWMFLPPFFRWTESEELTKYHLPFPFVQIGSGEVEKFYVWPFWGTKRLPGNSSWFYFWPLVNRQRIDKPEGVKHRFRAFPFVWTDWMETREEGGAEPEVLSRYFKLWPFFSWRRIGDQGMFRLLELWPLKNTGPMERNLTAFWTLYKRTWIEDAAESEFLWGLYRHRRGPDGYRYLSLFPLFSCQRGGQLEDSSSFSFLKGFFGMERHGETRRWQLLYFLRFGGKEESP